MWGYHCPVESVAQKKDSTIPGWHSSGSILNPLDVCEHNCTQISPEPGRAMPTSAPGYYRNTEWLSYQPEENTPNCFQLAPSRRRKMIQDNLCQTCHFPPLLGVLPLHSAMEKGMEACCSVRGEQGRAHPQGAGSRGAMVQRQRRWCPERALAPEMVWGHSEGRGFLSVQQSATSPLQGSCGLHSAWKMFIGFQLPHCTSG